MCLRRHKLTSHALQRMRVHVHHRHREDRRTLTNGFIFMRAHVHRQTRVGTQTDRDRQTLTERLLGLSKLVADVIVKQSYEVREHRSCKDSISQIARHPASLRCRHSLSSRQTNQPDLHLTFKPAYIHVLEPVHDAVSFPQPPLRAAKSTPRHAPQGTHPKTRTPRHPPVSFNL